MVVSTRVSIIIPCFNEEQSISKCLDALSYDDLSSDALFIKENTEIILVDGGSSDATLELVKTHNVSVKIIPSELGRAKQMNLGALQSSGEVLVFLHADSIVPEEFLNQLQMFANQKNKVWGRFDIYLSNQGLVFRVIEQFINYRSRWSNIVTGDQAMFVKRKVFESVGGFAEIPLMEDVELSKRLKKLSTAYCIDFKIQTSSRRWEADGVLKTVILMWILRFAYFMGVKPERLHKIYYDI